MYTTVEVIHDAFFEKGANTGEGVRLEFSGPGQAPVEIRVFGVGRTRRIGRRFAYGIALWNGAERIQFREYESPDGLAHWAMMAQEASRLLAALEEAGWQQTGEPLSKKEDYGWGNRSEETRYRLQPAEGKGPLPAEIPQALIDAIRAEAK